MANEKRLIDASAFLAELEKFINPMPDEYGLHFISGISTAIAEIEDAPTVDAVEVVHGRWLYDSGSERYFCSSCNETALYTSKDEPIFDYDWEENLRYSHTETYLEEHLTNYCPNCGAKMDGDGNG